VLCCLLVIASSSLGWFRAVRAGLEDAKLPAAPQGAMAPDAASRGGRAHLTSPRAPLTPLPLHSRASSCWCINYVNVRLRLRPLDTFLSEATSKCEQIRPLGIEHGRDRVLGRSAWRSNPVGDTAGEGGGARGTELR
jgi:hypothetical protein